MTYDYITNDYITKDCLTLIMAYKVHRMPVALSGIINDYA